MSVENLTIYEGWNISQPDVPVRSRLFSLRPVGVGTPMVEGLTSYMMRLAQLHSLPNSLFISRLISPNLQTTFLKDWSSRSMGALFQKASALEGHGELAIDFVQALSGLTLRNDLSFLTLSIWKDVLPDRGLLKKNRAWCPLCYQESWRLHQFLYEPLIWSLQVVKVCSRHGLYLWRECPNCRSEQPFLTSNSILGECCNCHQLLFPLTEKESFSDLFSIVGDDELIKNMELTNYVESLIEVMPHLTFAPRRDNLYHNIALLVDRVTFGNISAFASLLNLPKNTVWGWYHGEFLPSLESLLKVSQCVNLPPDILLRSKIDDLEDMGCWQLPKTRRVQRSSPRHLDLNVLRERLLSALNLPDRESLPLLQVAQTLGFDRRTLVSHFPAECKAISAKYRRMKKAIRDETIDLCCDEVRDITRSLYESGKYPSESSVAKLLSHPGFLRYPKVRSAFQTAKCNLGVEP